MSARTTDLHVMHALHRVADLLIQAGVITRRHQVTLHGGNSSYKIANTLIVDGSDVWKGAGGRSKGDAYNALAVMEATLRLVVKA